MDFIRLMATERAAVAKDYHFLTAAAEDAREVEWEAAVKIQSAWRGYRSRQRILKWRESAKMLQKNFRLVKQKIERRRFVINALEKRREETYHTAAVKFQAAWKGYYSRKKIHDFYGRWKPYMAKLKHDSILVKKALSSFRQREEERIEKDRVRTVERAHMRKVNREHHLLSTTVTDGVYQKGESEVTEQELRASVLDLHLTRKPAMHLTRFGQPLQRWSQHSPTKTLPLPKVQGPFKSPEEVARIKGMQPMLSLRASTDFQSAEKAQFREKQEEWCKRINEHHIKPWSTKARPFNPYMSQLTNSTAFSDRMDHRLSQSLGPLVGDGSVRLPTKTMNTGLLRGKRGFDATVTGVDTFDHHEIKYGR